MSRSIQDIQSEYNAECAKAGHLQYTLSAIKKELDSVNSKLESLNKEANELTVASANAPVQSGEASNG